MSKNEITEIAHLRSEMGIHPVFTINGTEPKVALFQPGIGAPLSVGLFEEAIALGGRKFIACGGAGNLDSSTPAARIMIPVAAIRDEGTSYHYLPPEEKVYPTQKALSSLVNFLEDSKLPYEKVKTWTTDGIYRETKGKINLRKKQGCKCVEMETAALFAVAKFRNVEFAQILFSGDDVSGDDYDERGWRGMTTAREKVFYIATKACQLI
ncbi:MAG: nucleoside phosphorylase [Planctomycetes bacterium]|nr:nucleoside phosphorylase [Planctomycetota bacterium]